MRKLGLFSLLFLLVLVVAACGAPAGAPAGGEAGGGEAAAPSGDSQLPVDVPRNEVFVADQIFRYSVIDNYNFWVNGPQEPHRHALMMETLWYRDQETGERIYNLERYYNNLAGHAEGSDYLPKRFT